MPMLCYILWNPDIFAFRIGAWGVRWYSLCWLVGLVVAYFLVKWLYKDQRQKDEAIDPLFFYCFAGVLVGARLGHCLFYQPDYFLSSGKHFIEMLLPVKFAATGWDWTFVGYEGLASHGGAIGLMVALWLYCRRTGVSLWLVLDDIGLVAPLTGCCIRLGNLMNSEIIGKVTDVPWAFIFELVDQAPRHPGQLYEAMAYACFFLIGWAIYRHRRVKAGTGFYFGLCLTLVFTFRFFIEFTKDIQVAFEQYLPLDMGQILSLPFVVLGIWCICRKGGQTSQTTRKK